MRILVRTAGLTALAIGVLTTGLAAQDQFGRAVAVTDSDVFVLKPSPGQGPAAVYVYRLEGGEWRVVDRLSPATAAESGHGLSPSLEVTPAGLVVGSGDPQIQLGAHFFRRTGADSWDSAGSIPLAASDGAAPTTAALDLPTLMRILQPPSRVVAVDGEGERMAVAVVGGPAGRRGVRIFERDGTDWVSRGQLAPSTGGATDQFGTALALREDRVLVGAPRNGAAGAVFVFARDETGTWREESVVVPADSASGQGFGSSISLDGDDVLVGAPGADVTGAVMVLTRSVGSGSWQERARLAPADSAARRFGAAIATADGEAWIGAPATAGTGRVYRFARSTSGWTEAATPTVSGVEAGSGLGVAVAVTSRVAVVGAPGANGGRGGVAVFTRAGSGAWSEAVWLQSGRTLEAVASGEVQCSEGRAATFACDNVDLMAFLPVSSMGGSAREGVSDVWGWTDPTTGREYALVGRSGGAAFVDITTPAAPVYLGYVPANRSGARDLKVYRDHLFFTGDGAGAHGLLVFDLTRLRAVTNPPVTFEPDAKYDGIASAHNLILDTDAGFAYPVGASGGGETCGGGLHMVDIRDPLNPTFAGCYTDTEGLIWPGRTHDGQCVVYRGPDEDYRGREICFASNETALRIVDVTDKTNPTPLAAATYPGLAYVHQGWLTEDQRYFYLDDELDELIGQTQRTKTLVWDVSELDDPVLVGEYFGPDGGTDHNLYVKGDRMYQANYQSGFRVIDISDPEQPVEIGYFDTTPYEGNPPGFNGAWTAYPFFDSGTVIVSSMREGLFILKPRRPELVP